MTAPGQSRPHSKRMRPFKFSTITLPIICYHENEMVIRFSNRLVRVLTVVILVALAGYGVYFWFQSQSEKGSVFSGQASFIEGNKITLKGAFNLKPGETLSGIAPFAGVFDFEVNDETKFVRDEVKWPTDEEAKKMGSFDIDELPHKKTRGSLTDLAEVFNSGSPVYVTAEFPVKIILSSVPAAADIPASLLFYRVFAGAFPVNTEEDEEDNE